MKCITLLLEYAEMIGERGPAEMWGPANGSLAASLVVSTGHPGVLCSHRSLNGKLLEQGDK